MKYTSELLTNTVKQVSNFTELAKALNLSPVGSNLTHLKRCCIKHNVDVSHFTPPGFKHGRKTHNSTNAERTLVLGVPLQTRVSVLTLRRALLQTKRQYRCEHCPNDGTWNGKSLTLQIDHINGCYWDNRPENLRFLCPNCHTQTNTWGNKTN